MTVLCEYRRQVARNSKAWRGHEIAMSNTQSMLLSLRSESHWELNLPRVKDHNCICRSNGTFSDIPNVLKWRLQYRRKYFSTYLIEVNIKYIISNIVENIFD